jgi:acetyl esterase/lipase
MDPEVVAGIVADGRFSLDEPGPEPTLELLAQMRAMPPMPFDPVAPEGVVREERLVGGVPVRVYSPAGPASGAAIVWMHGGGLMMGSYDWDQPGLDALVAATGCVAYSVDYRLAPEAPYPAALDDCFAVLSAVEAERLAVGGSSAGAGLAAALALRARDAGIALVHQHLLYPMLDDRQVTASSQWDGLAIWPRELNAFAWRLYLGEVDEVPEYAAPARAVDLAGLAPAYLHVGALDGFASEVVDYGARLLAAGVPVELHVFPEVPHAFDLVAPDAGVTRRAVSLSDAALARVLG